MMGGRAHRIAGGIAGGIARIPAAGATDFAFHPPSILICMFYPKISPFQAPSQAPFTNFYTFLHIQVVRFLEV